MGASMPFHVYKYLGALAEPMNLFAFLLFFSALFALLPWWDGARKLGRVMCFLLATFLLAMAVLPLGEWALRPLENRYAVPQLPAKVDGIVMLTGDESPTLSEDRGTPIAGNAAQRHLFMARLAKRYPKARMVVVGNTWPFRDDAAKGAMTTRKVIEDIFRGIDIPLDRVEFESRSRTTRENASFAKDIVKPKEGQTWLLLTSASHMPRAVSCFEKEGMKFIPVPTDYFTYPELLLGPRKPDAAGQIRLLNVAVHEYIGLLSYWMAGWIERPWP